MNFFEHLDDFRNVLFKSIAAIGINFVLFFIILQKWFDAIILAPCRQDFPLYNIVNRTTEWINIHSGWKLSAFNNEFHVEIVTIKLTSQFITHMSLSLWLAFLFSLPLLLYFFWNFTKPALFPHERIKVKRVFVLGWVLFVAGVLVGYFVVFPFTLRFLISYDLSSLIKNQLSLDSYISNFSILILFMGLMFEIPVVAIFLSKIGLLTKSFLRKYRKHAILIALILAAVITPTGDPFTLMVVFIPIWFLYELSIFLVKSETGLPSI